MRVPLALRRRDPPPLPWRAPRHEVVLLVLVALAALTPVYSINAQDASRVCLARSLAHLEVTADTCLSSPLAVDKAVYHGQLYSDKAPGMSLLEVPSVAAARVGDPSTWHHESLRLWVPRVFSSGIAFLLCVFLVGRISEGIARGAGGVSMVVEGWGRSPRPSRLPTSSTTAPACSGSPRSRSGGRDADSPPVSPPAPRSSSRTRQA